jgi:peroxiredoxin
MATGKMQSFIDQLVASGVGDTALALHGIAPRFALPDPAERIVELETLLATGPVVLSFYRGPWCPYCSEELVGLQRQLPRFDELGATLVAISPALPDNSLTGPERRALAFPILSDARNEVAREYGLVFTMPEAVVAAMKDTGVDLETINGDDSHALPIPATYVVNTDRRVELAFVDPDFRKRAKPDEIVAALQWLRDGKLGKSPVSR